MPTTRELVQPYTTPLAMSMVALVGDGQLASVLMRRLENATDITVSGYRSLKDFSLACNGGQTALVVAVSDFWRPAHDYALQSWCSKHHVAFLRAGIWQREAAIGPLVLAGVPGCVECAERRRWRAAIHDMPHAVHFLEWCKDDERIMARLANPWATAIALDTVGALAALEIQTFISQGVPHMGLHSVRFVELRSLGSTCHTFLPDPLCPLCGQMIEDDGADAVLHFVPRLRSTDHPYRLRSLDEEVEVLEKQYVDPLLGIQVEPTAAIRTGSAAFATTYTCYYEYPYLAQHITGSGFTPSFRSSRAIAIIEALERYCGLFPRARRAVVYGSYHQLRDHAIDPAQLGVYSPEQYARYRRDSRRFCVAYHPDLSYYWMWGYSLRKKQPVLVPEQVAYYASAKMRPARERFLHDTSNGCAIGASLEEATLYGLFEALERDAFFLTWYARLKLPAIDPHTARDTGLKLALERLERMANFTFYAFDGTTDFGIPVVVCVGVNTLDQAPKMVCAASARWNPDRALASAFYEVAAGISDLQNCFPRELERGQRLVNNSSLVVNMDDHALVSAMPQAFPRISFLLQGQAQQSMQERFAAQYATGPSPDLTQDLMRAVERVLARGYDVVVVNQTAPELQATGLHCVRVLVPGLVPMAFGHDFRRLYGIERLYRLPVELGYSDHVLSEAELNPYPHPFP
ncbi:MAG TPA: TOMM precursor leader peptide-binding protein [Ktedonobacteraceae bacterium]|nr:TOMM precursor leader peptide-binding protein [Ktedonobacteraceae bacterium]